MSFYVSQSCCPTKNEQGHIIKGYVPELLFHVDANQHDSILQLKFYVGIHSKFNLPVNSILLDIDSNIFLGENINLNIDFYTKHFTWLNGSINIDLKESDLFSKPLYHLNTYFIASFKINDEAFNRANIDISKDGYSMFINELYSNNNKSIDQKTNITNIFNLFDLNITNINSKYITDYQHYKILPRDFYNLDNLLNPFTPQLLVKNYINNSDVYYFNKLFDIVNNDNFFFEVSEISLNLNYLINNKEKNFKIDDIKNKEIKTNFNFINDEIIEDSIDGVNGIYIPAKSEIKLTLWFKYKYSYYYFNYKVVNKNQLYGWDRNSLFYWEVINEI